MLIRSVPVVQYTTREHLEGGVGFTLLLEVVLKSAEAQWFQDWCSSPDGFLHALCGFLM